MKTAWKPSSSIQVISCSMAVPFSSVTELNGTERTALNSAGVFPNPDCDSKRSTQNHFFERNKPKIFRNQLRSVQNYLQRPNAPPSLRVPKKQQGHENVTSNTPKGPLTYPCFKFKVKAIATELSLSAFWPKPAFWRGGPLKTA